MTKRIYNYIAQGLQDLELLENLKEKKKNNEISDSEMPLLYNDFPNYNQERDFNQAINDSLQTKTKSYQEYCQEMQDKTNGQNTLSIQKVEIENQVLHQQIDSEYLIGLYKYENIKKILEQIVGVIDESVESMNESLSEDQHFYSFVEYKRKAFAIVQRA
ncbi:1328_t:CDS:2 [Cetraspora pellucida]|uniref:1328_t:CDS:1 n=1 Tax=Cetraspora pellucida TaxID=1433469 RepID=A0ACA9JZU2_9GLOM|nr:1328_t:CDS:2 [Cetraspora pellucida]